MCFRAEITRIVRESDYSPASSLFAEIVKKCCTTKFGQILSFHLKILNGNEILRSIKGNNSATNLEKNDG